MSHTILMHGPSGSGKDTQVDLLKEKYECEKIGTGEMFRSLVNDEDGKYTQVNELINQGKFISSELTYALLGDWLKQYDSNKNWIFISVVRKADQIALFDKLLEPYGRTLDLFLHFNLSTAEAVERMSLRKNCVVCGKIYHSKYNPEKFGGKCDDDGGNLIHRDDDHPDAIRSRLDEYNRTIEPILEEYRNRGILIEVDASPQIEVIHSKILEIVKRLG